jgi:Skp family chaperone for outer membrane proteins
MKSRNFAIGVVSVLSLSLYVSMAPAQQPAARPAGTNIALLDVNWLFKNSPRLKQRLEELKAEIARAENQLNTEKDRIAKLADELRQYKKGTPDYKRMEEEVTKSQTELQVQFQLQQGEFKQRRAKVFFEAYQEVYSLTEAFCNQYGIDMVMQFNGDQPDVEQPESMLGYVAKPMVWHKQQLDITPRIYQMLNQQQGVAAPPATANRNNNAAPARPQGVPFTK